MALHVVFVLPPYNYSRSVGNARKKKQIGLMPPLGVGYLAAAIEAAGHTADLVDAVAEQFDVEEAARAVANLAPDVVGISSFTTLTPNDAYALARALRHHLPETPFIMGGPHVTSFARQILAECPEVDVLAPGDGEWVLVELLACIEAGRSWDQVKGILYRDASGACCATPQAPLVEDIDVFPPPARHLYRDELYSPLPSLSSRRPVTSIITSRGCPWGRCKFCYQGGEYASPYRRRSPEDVVAEIRMLVEEKGIRNLVFWDDNFCHMPEWIARFCALLEAARLKVIWSVLSRVNTVTPEMLRQMKRAGCYSIQFGIETGNRDILRLVRKGHTLDQCRKAVRWAKEAGLETRAFFMLGFPTETPEMSEATLRFAFELNLDYVVFFAYYVAPGTALAELALREGHCRDFESQQLASYIPNSYPSADALEAKVKSAYRRYYLRPAYIRRALWRALLNPRLLKNHVAGFVYWLGLMLRRAR